MIFSGLRPFDPLAHPEEEMTHTSQSSFAIDVPDALLLRLRQGEHAAFEQIYRWFERPVHTLALRICGDREQAADVLQETMLKAFDRIESFRGQSALDGNLLDGSPFWGWLRQIAVNESLMVLRRRKRLDDGLDGDSDDDGIGGYVDESTPPPPAAADAACLQRALDALPPTTRTVLWLYHGEGYTHDEIAALMSRTVSFSKSQLSRGIRRLRELLEPDTIHPREATHG